MIINFPMIYITPIHDFCHRYSLNRDLSLDHLTKV